MSTVRLVVVEPSESKFDEEAVKKYDSLLSQDTTYCILKFPRCGQFNYSLYISVRHQNVTTWVPVEYDEKIIMVPTNIYSMNDRGIDITKAPVEVLIQQENSVSCIQEGREEEEKNKQDYNFEDNIPLLIAACQTFNSSYQARQISRESQEIFTIRDARNLPIASRYHRKTASTASVGSIASAGSQESRPAAHRRGSATSFWTPRSTTGTSTTGIDEYDVDLFNGQGPYISEYFGPDLITSIQELYEFLTQHSYVFSDPENRNRCPGMTALVNLMYGLKDYMIFIKALYEKHMIFIKALNEKQMTEMPTLKNFADSLFNVEPNNEGEKQKKATIILEMQWILGAVFHLKKEAELSGLQKFITGASRIAGAITVAFSAAHLGTTLSVGVGVTLGGGIGFVSVATMGLFGAGLFLGYRLGKSVGNLLDPSIPPFQDFSSRVSRIEKTIHETLPNSVVKEKQQYRSMSENNDKKQTNSPR